MPPVVKNLLLINVLFFIATWASMANVDLRFVLGLYNFSSAQFEPYQLVTHMFMHGNFAHILFNMFALIMFGSVLERIWGPKRFFIYYLITGFGAVILHSLASYLELNQLRRGIDVEVYNTIREIGFEETILQGKNFADPLLSKINTLLNAPMMGASGAIFGLLVGFGMLFPNTELMLIFLPIPIKAKYFIPILIVIEFFLGLGDYEWDNVAHFAHLGGALFGFILVKIWQNNRSNFY
jgi:membrane associated rhomboid family serine protease